MASTSVEINRRSQDRTKAVLPVRVWGKDAAGSPFQETAHTLDITPTGARLGAIHHALKAEDKLTVQYRQRRAEFRVVWTKLLDGAHEYQVGLQATTKEKEVWG
jgi:hypothetical protein